MNWTLGMMCSDTTPLQAILKQVQCKCKISIPFPRHEGTWETLSPYGMLFNDLHALAIF